MVYCNLDKIEKDSVIYCYGSTPEDITGRVRFNYVDGWFDILEEPKGKDAPFMHIIQVYERNKMDFKKGIFNSKLAYEI